MLNQKTRVLAQKQEQRATWKQIKLPVASVYDDDARCRRKPEIHRGGR